MEKTLLFRVNIFELILNLSQSIGCNYYSLLLLLLLSDGRDNTKQQAAVAFFNVAPQ